MRETVCCIVAHDGPPFCVNEGFVLHSKDNHLTFLGYAIQAVAITVAITQGE